MVLVGCLFIDWLVIWFVTCGIVVVLVMLYIGVLSQEVGEGL